MIYELATDNIAFPNPRFASRDGLLAYGGDLSVKRLLSAYSHGIFPWYSEGEPILWWSPDPRMVLFPQNFRCSDSLRRTIKRGRYEVRIDTCFECVMRECASVPREGQCGTWITEDMVKAYVALHNEGHAHSFETFYDGRLVGGLYGVAVGGVFCGESMFHIMRDASKVAFARLVEFCKMNDIRMIDAQQETEHLASLGARPIPRLQFLDEIGKTDSHPRRDTKWASHSVVLLLGGNEGDREKTLGDARRLINEEVGAIASLSVVCESAPWGFDASQWFLNQAIVAETELPPEEVLRKVLDIEQRLGRKRIPQDENQDKATYASRPIDIDIIFYDSQIVDTLTLKIPHPLMHLRRFVLKPLSQVCPNFVHPLLRKSIIQLEEECTDTNEVRFLNCRNGHDDGCSEK